MNMKTTAWILAIVLSTAVTAQAQTQPSRTAEVIDRFNQAFARHDPSLLEGLIAEDCVMERVEPEPDGTRVVGREANLKYWQNLANNRDGQFAVEDGVVFGDNANIRWRYRFGPGLSQSVRGVTLVRLRDGLIVEALGYSKNRRRLCGDGRAKCLEFRDLLISSHRRCRNREAALRPSDERGPRATSPQGEDP